MMLWEDDSLHEGNYWLKLELDHRGLARKVGQLRRFRDSWTQSDVGRDVEVQMEAIFNAVSLFPNSLLQVTPRPHHNNFLGHLILVLEDD